MDTVNVLSVEAQQCEEALTNAADHQNAEELSFAFQKFRDLDLPSDVYQSALQKVLFIAIRKGNTDMFEKVLVVLKDFIPNDVQTDFSLSEIVLDEKNLLYTAAECGQLEAVHLLAQHFGIPLFSPGPNKNSAVNIASRNGHVEVVRYLVDRGACIYTPNSDGFSPLNSAAAGGNLEVCQYLWSVLNMSQSALISQIRTPKGESPLHNAAVNGHTHVCEWLLQIGCQPNAEAENGYTPFHAAAESGNVSTIDLIGRACVQFLAGDTSFVNRPTADRTPGLGRTPLIFAAVNFHTQAVEYLVQLGADVNFKTQIGSTAFVEVVKQRALKDDMDSESEKSVVETLEVLRRLGADVNAVDKGGMSAIHWAAVGGMTKVLLHLLNIGAAITADKSESTLLHHASKAGNVETVALVLKYMEQFGGFIDAQNSSGYTALHCATELAHLDVAKVLLQAMVERPALLSGQFDINVLVRAEDGGSTLLQLLHSTENKNPEKSLELCQLLVNYGADVNTPNSFGMTSLHKAAQIGSREVCQFLISRGANVNAVSHSGMTPLMAAAENGKIVVCELLTQLGATAAAKTLQEEKTALHFAAEVHFLRPIKHGGVSVPPDQAAAYLVQLLLTNGAPLEALDDEGRSALMRAVETASPHMIRALIQAGANVHCLVPDSSKDQGTYTLVTYLLYLSQWLGNDRAPSPSRIKDCLGVLLQAGAQPTGVSGQGVMSPLQLASRIGSKKYGPEMINMLLQYGADVFQLDEGGACPLYYTTDERSFLEYLTATGPSESALAPPRYFLSPNAPIGVNGFTPVMIFVQKFDRPDSFKRLLDSKMAERVNFEFQCPTNGWTILHATIFYKKDSTQLLLEREPRLAVVPDAQGFTPLHLAALVDNDKAVFDLLKFSIDVNALTTPQPLSPVLTDPQSNEVPHSHLAFYFSSNTSGAEAAAAGCQLPLTPLWIAVISGSSNVAHTLLHNVSQPPDLNYRGPKNQTLLEYALLAEHWKIVKELLEIQELKKQLALMSGWSSIESPPRIEVIPELLGSSALGRWLETLSTDHIENLILDTLRKIAKPDTSPHKVSPTAGIMTSKYTNRKIANVPRRNMSASTAASRPAGLASSPEASDSPSLNSSPSRGFNFNFPTPSPDGLFRNVQSPGAFGSPTPKGGGAPGPFVFTSP